MSGLTKLEHRHIFGLKGDVKNNIWYVDENVVVYPCGHNSVIYNTETREQHFIHGADSHTFVSEGITALSVTPNPNKRFLAVAERSERPQINMYDISNLQNIKRRKVLTYAEIGSREFVSIAFSGDNKFCLTMGGSPEWTLVSWAWEKAKVVASAKVSNANGAAINQADYCPADPNVVCVSGNGILKFFKIADGQFKPVQTAIKRDPQNYLCHCWLSDDRVVVATDTGDLLLFDNFEFKLVLQSGIDDVGSIDCMVPYTKGFCCGGAGGTLRVYERSDDSREYYKMAKVFKIEGNLCRITNLAMSPSEDNLTCTLENHQVYVLGLSNTDILKEDVMNFDLLATAFHQPGEGGSAQITGLDTCTRKPLVVTCGLDKSVRVWNYMEKTTDLMKTFKEEAYSVAFHPSGLHIVVGFSDKLRLLNLLMDDIRAVREFNIKQCREVRFSNGGQYLAAANNNMVQVYHTYSCELIVTLRGHNAKVRSLTWKSNDKQLLTCGMDGSVILWDVLKPGGPKVSEHMVSRVHYSSVAWAGEGQTAYVVGNDELLKEVDMTGTSAKVRSEIESNVPLGQVAVSKENKVVFVGTAAADRPGMVRAYPLGGGAEYQEYQIHAGPITRLRMSPDGQYLFTASDDGAVCVLEVKRDGNVKAGKKERENPLPFAEEILVTKSDLEEKTTHMQELKLKVDELTQHNEYQLRLKDMNYKDRIKEVSEKFTSELNQDRKRYDDLVEDKREMEDEYEEKLGELDLRHTDELRKMEDTYKAKIASEQQRYAQLVQERDEQNLTWDDENQQLVESHQQFLAQLTADYDAKVTSENDAQISLGEKKEQLSTDFEEHKALIEEDADMEVVEVKEKNEAKLNAEREATLRLKGENGIMKKKFSALQKDIEDQKEEIRSLHEKEKELYEQIKGLEKDIQGHKKEIREREETIQDKEKRIYDLKKKNQELEKFKFVLDYKIKELKRQIEPREKEITDMRQQIEEMDLELEQYHKSNAALDLMIGELRLKMDGMQREINEQRSMLGEGSSLVRRVRTDLRQCIEHLDDHKSLKKAVTSLYKKYVQDQDAADAGSEADVQREYNRQREYLEKSVESLKRKLAKDMQMHHTENSRLMREGVSLTREINTLRREAKFMQLTSKHTGLGGSSSAMPPPAPGSAGMMGGGGGEEEEAAWREAEMQQQEVQRMTQILQELESAMGGGGAAPSQMAGTVRPGSREQLPPLQQDGF
jgi:WD40 repeat protein